MLVAIAVVMGLGWLGHLESTPATVPSGFAFGQWKSPDLVQLSEPSLQSLEATSNLAIEAPPGIRFYRLQTDDTDFQRIHFVDSKNRRVGAIELFPASTDTWPPERLDFCDSIFGIDFDITLSDSQRPERQEIVRVSLPLDKRLDAKTISYRNAVVEWTSPFLSAAWPVRAHLGKCRIGDQNLLLKVREFDAQSPSVDYESPPFSELVDAIREEI